MGILAKIDNVSETDSPFACNYFYLIYIFLPVICPKKGGQESKVVRIDPESNAWKHFNLPITQKNLSTILQRDGERETQDCCTRSTWYLYT